MTPKDKIKKYIIGNVNWNRERKQMTPKELSQTIVKILAYYPSLKEVPAGEWNRITAILQQAKSEWCKKQRKICLHSYLETKAKNLITIIRNETIEDIDIGLELKESILNAPEPE